MSQFVAHDGTALVEVPALPTYDNLRGQQAQRRFRGPPALILAKYNELLATGVQSMRISEMADGIAYELSADYPGAVGSNGQIDPAITPVLTDWTLEPIEVAKSIWEFPAVVAQFDRLGSTEALYQKQRIKNIADALVRGETEVPEELLKRASPLSGAQSSGKTVLVTIAGFLSFVSDAGLDTVVFSGLIRDLIGGVTTWIPNSWNLRRTRRIPMTNAFQESVERVGRMMTTSSLISLEGFSTSSLRSALPSGGYWLKKAPFDRPIGDGNREVTTDFVWTESYSLFLFGDPV